jgi:predicted short-subunit dehydrogenase-like oxidoreductase (DUF2520 family)
MESMVSNKILLLGAGKLAWHLGPALRRAGYDIRQVYSRSKESARSLARELEAEWTTDPGELSEDAEILLFCLKDSAVREFPCFIELKKRVMMIHTAGSLPMDIFKGISTHYGVLYPMMTFTRERSIDLSGVPFCIEGSDPETTTFLESMAASISKRVYRLNSAQRQILHIAGIIASNFPNHMYHLAAGILEEADLDFGLLGPLILETAAKAVDIGPEAAQTGPASRNDEGIIREHIELLKDRPELQKIYTFVSNSIINHNRPDE